MVNRSLARGVSTGVDSLQRQAGGYQQMQTSPINLGLAVALKVLFWDDLQSQIDSAQMESANIWWQFI